jgi:hypothetical protein
MSYGREFDLICLRHSLDTLVRLRGGWRPSKRLLSRGRNADRWKINREEGATAYQFVGISSEPPVRTSIIIATVLAFDPTARWALLFADRWIALGEPFAMAPQADPAEVTRCAEGWLRSEIRRETSGRPSLTLAS